MKLTDCKVEYGWISFKVESIQAALKVRTQFKPGDYELAAVRKKRSRNANDYAWALMTQISNILGISPVEVYRNEIRDVAPKVRFIYCKVGEEMLEASQWTANHLGRDFKVIHSDDGWSYCMETYGSSDFDTKQMSQLIENIIQDCEALEIPTKDQGYIDSLLESWNGR